MPKLRNGALILCAAGAFGVTSTPALAGEGGASFYLLGSGGPGAAELPPLKGIYADNTFYYYSGDASASREFIVNGNVVAGLDVSIPMDFATLLWVPSTDALGGTLAITGTLPVARPDFDVDVVLIGPGGGTIALDQHDAATVVADPVVSAGISWNVGKSLHSALTGTVSIPVGTYREGELANVSFHRWIFDLSSALTWHDPKTGWDISGKVGLTFNGKNDFTDYNSGNDFHLEASVQKSFSKTFSAGLQFYHLQQISGDSGEGAVLGSFKGRVTGIGPTAAYTFMLGGKVPLAARLRYFEEFGAKNRLDARSIFFSLSMPLHVNMPAGPPPAP